MKNTLINEKVLTLRNVKEIHFLKKRFKNLNNKLIRIFLLSVMYLNDFKIIDYFSY